MFDAATELSWTAKGAAPTCLIAKGRGFKRPAKSVLVRRKMTTALSTKVAIDVTHFCRMDPGGTVNVSSPHTLLATGAVKGFTFTTASALTPPIVQPNSRHTLDGTTTRTIANRRLHALDKRKRTQTGAEISPIRMTCHQAPNQVKVASAKVTRAQSASGSLPARGMSAPNAKGRSTCWMASA